MKEIIMYTSETCPHCKTAKDFLRSSGYKYTEKNVSRDPLARQELMKLKIMGVPAFIVGNESVVGLDLQRIEHLLDYTVETCPSCHHRSRVPKGKGKLRVTCSKCQSQYFVDTVKM
jgi:glutaredoxin